MMKKTTSKSNAKPPTPSGAAGESRRTDRAAIISSGAAVLAALFADEAAETALIRYDIGAHTNELKNAERTHGKGVVAEVADAVGRDADTLYNCARVAEAFERPIFTSLAAEKNAAGVPLSFSHFVALATKDGKSGAGLPEELQMHLFERALHESLPVRALRDAVRAALAGGEESDGPPRSTLDELMKMTGALLKRTDALAGLLERLESKGVEPANLDQLTLTSEQLEEATAVCARLLARLRAVRPTKKSSRAAA